MLYNSDTCKLLCFYLGAHPRHGDQEDAVPGEVLRAHGGPPSDRGQQLRQLPGQGGAAGVPDPGPQGVSEENI